MEFIQVITTVDSREAAQKIADTLVAKHLAGCVQVIGPIVSTYRWQGDIERADEWLCLIKSSRDLYHDLERAIREAHPYEVPEILAMPIVAGAPDYLVWLSEQLIMTELR
jgi:periplasmic divalent cation tolerance protein